MFFIPSQLFGDVLVRIVISDNEVPVSRKEGCVSGPKKVCTIMDGVS